MTPRLGGLRDRVRYDEADKNTPRRYRPAPSLAKAFMPLLSLDVLTFELLCCSERKIIKAGANAYNTLTLI
jgi:hypothetical protein